MPNFDRYTISTSIIIKTFTSNTAYNLKINQVHAFLIVFYFEESFKKIIKLLILKMFKNSSRIVQLHDKYGTIVKCVLDFR